MDLCGLGERYAYAARGGCWGLGLGLGLGLVYALGCVFRPLPAPLNPAPNTPPTSQNYTTTARGIPPPSMVAMVMVRQVRWLCCGSIVVMTYRRLGSDFVRLWFIPL
ncbi:hypothetical protein M501DRAFT_506158 [Patellaria atrata CBS 101060]|uniref:Uncharacterized protein n=1 Tax=Patellaria atrata CBS 101060 TaxID=1346257 RepID=A0A9P4S2Z0_9PEZI|nr:hypothetical protein M501DRAFT_506158 [Patellaria atrata CBS 101060]